MRMEPVFMILGQSAATAACIAVDERKNIQDINYQSLKTRLLEDGQVLSADAP
ncbi:MAG TPA: FAD-dependent oxidoreductase [Bacteroidales bacterium]|nr:FAD-dependent oxidoreductase [Bacteroidales bacterium]